MSDANLTRRLFLGSACSAAAAPLATPLVMAATPGDQRLVVIILRGGMDALAAVQPYADPAFHRLRPTLAQTPAQGLSDLDGYFGLGAPFSGLLPLWRAGEVAFIHAVSTPYRGKRSHFDGQDFLENGGASSDGRLTRDRDGWLNRALSLIPGARTDHAMAVGHDDMMLLRGQAPHGAWSPTTDLTLRQDERRLLTRLYAQDPLFQVALEDALVLAGNTDDAVQRETAVSIARFAADQLNQEARVIGFSLGNWDTHRRQDRAMRRPARQLTEALVMLRDGLGRNWQDTTVIAMTEFGRTARENGSGGTDHGTGGVAVLAGGTIRGRTVYGTWPGVGEGQLYEDRDLLPTEDLRRWAGWVLAAKLGLSRSDISRSVFPGVDFGQDPGLFG